MIPDHQKKTGLPPQKVDQKNNSMLLKRCGGRLSDEDDRCRWRRSTQGGEKKVKVKSLGGREKRDFRTNFLGKKHLTGPGCSEGWTRGRLSRGKNGQKLPT